VSPSNRPSKDQRAATNRAARQARTARSQNAKRVSAESSTSSSGTRSGGGSGWFGRLFGPPRPAADRSTAPATPTGGARAPAPVLGRRPAGQRAVLFALIFAVVGGIALFFIRIPVGEDGDPLTSKELDEYEDANRDYDTDSTWNAYGPIIILQAAVPVAVAGVAFNGVKGPRRARTTLFCMIGMAAVSLLLNRTPFVLAAMVALGVANFQIRRADMRAAAAPAADASTSTGEVIEADVVEDDAVGDDVVEATAVEEDQRRD
jgi:hypothetical protein